MEKCEICGKDIGEQCPGQLKDRCFDCWFENPTQKKGQPAKRIGHETASNFARAMKGAR